MNGVSSIRTIDALRASGWTVGAIKSAVRSGRLVRVRCGIYCDGDQWRRSEASVVERHRLEVHAVWATMGRRGWATGYSAALLLGLPVPHGQPGMVTYSLPRRPHGRRTYPGLQLRTATVAPSDVVLAHGAPVTRAARTALDLARSYGFAAGLVVADAGLRERLVLPGEFDEIAARMARWRGATDVRRVAGHADGRREAPSESVSYAVFVNAGLPLPECNPWVVGYGRGGIRADFRWSAHRLVGEVDGRVKYAEPTAGAESVLVEEKERQLRIEETGLVVVRWTAAEAMYRPAVLVDRVLRQSRIAAEMFGVPALRLR